MKKTLQNCMVASFCHAFVFYRKSTCKSCCYRLMSMFFSMQKRKERRKLERSNLMTQGLYGVNTICKAFSIVIVLNKHILWNINVLTKNTYFWSTIYLYQFSSIILILGYKSFSLNELVDITYQHLLSHITIRTHAWTRERNFRVMQIFFRFI